MLGETESGRKSCQICNGCYQIAKNNYTFNYTCVKVMLLMVSHIFHFEQPDNTLCVLYVAISCL